MHNPVTDIKTTKDSESLCKFVNPPWACSHGIAPPCHSNYPHIVIAPIKICIMCTMTIAAHPIVVAGEFVCAVVIDIMRTTTFSSTYHDHNFVGYHVFSASTKKPYYDSDFYQPQLPSPMPREL